MIVTGTDDIKAKFPNIDTSRLDVYTYGGLVVSAEETAGTYDAAKAKAKATAYRNARHKVEGKLGTSILTLIQDPMELKVGDPLAPLKNVARKQIDMDSSALVGTQWESKTLETFLDAVGYHGSHAFDGPALVYAENDIPGGIKVKSIWNGEMVNAFKTYTRSTSIVGEAVAPTEDDAKTKAINDAYREMRKYLMKQSDVFTRVPEKETLAGILEVFEQTGPNTAKLEKVYNVYKYEPRGPISKAMGY